MEPRQLAQPPFSDIHSDSLFGLFESNQVDAISQKIRCINQNAEAVNGEVPVDFAADDRTAYWARQQEALKNTSHGLQEISNIRPTHRIARTAAIRRRTFASRTQRLTLSLDWSGFGGDFDRAPYGHNLGTDRNEATWADYGRQS